MKKEKVINYLYCLIISFLFLLFTTENSFLYKFNPWVDANAFFTVGKSMMNGVVPYKDLFEQKGPFLYLIYGIGYLISNKSFIGVFFLEVISFSIFLYYASKIIEMFMDKKYIKLILPIFACLITTCESFVHGGSCEEFILPFFMITLYYFSKHFNEYNLSNKEIFFNGFLAGLVFMMKYIDIGLWFGFYLLIVIDYFKNKNLKKISKFTFIFLLGMFVPIIVFIIYFYINNGVYEFFKCYFIVNMTSYGIVKIGFIKRMLSMFYNIFINLCANRFIVIFIFSLVVAIISNIKKEKIFESYLLVLFIISLIFIYLGLVMYIYYPLPIFSFLIFSLIYLFKYNNVEKYINKKLFILVTIFCLIFSYFGANYRNMLFKSKKYYFQFKYADYINKAKNPTLLNVNTLDQGLYTTTGIIPTTRFFELQNLDYQRYSDNIDSIKKYISEGKTKFILICSKEKINENLYGNYKVVIKDRTRDEDGNKIYAYLFELIKK